MSVIAAYLIGATPFGYLIARWARGLDIRTVGSGNIGATNVGRVLGFRFFVLVFVLDLLKGFLPAWGFPRAIEAVTGQRTAALGVLVALASILGHNFPIYLRFKGGKGVATSLGAVLALDPIAALAAAGGFGVSLVATRYVSVSSLFAGTVFAVVHFARARAPFSREKIAMTLLTIALLILLFVRHRTNLRRLRSGAEPRVTLGRRKPGKPPEGKIAGVLLIAALVAGLTLFVTLQAAKRATLRVGRCTLEEVARVATGHQRAERLVFANRGRFLAVTCPRYNRVVVYRVTDDPGLELHCDIALQGRPVAIWPVNDRLYVLERPSGDARHVEPGFWETFDFDGQHLRPPYRVGFYPDDLAITPDGRHALVLTSGRAEGEPNRPPPGLTVVALGAVPSATAERVVGRAAFERTSADPDRITLSSSGRWAIVTLVGNDGTITIDLADPSRPRVAVAPNVRVSLVPSPRDLAGDLFPRPLVTDGEAIRLNLPAVGACVACSRPHESGLDLYAAASMQPLGRLGLRAALNLSPTRPTGVAQSAERGLLAAATRSGSVHLIAIRPHPDQHAVVAAKPGSGLRLR